MSGFALRPCLIATIVIGMYRKEHGSRSTYYSRVSYVKRGPPEIFCSQGGLSYTKRVYLEEGQTPEGPSIGLIA